jgi:ATP-binding cassette subfamily F protein 3
MPAGYNAPPDPMSLLVLHDVGKSFGAQDVLHAVRASVPHQARIGLVGPNGVGKSTLLRILAGEETPDSGAVKRARRLKVGFLPQEEAGRSASPMSVWELALGAFADLRRREQELARLEAELADPDRAAERLARYGSLQESFERDGGYRYATAARQVLRGIGFREADLERGLQDLSGGEQARARLARLLLDDPGLLLLDEPTNHLDLEAVEWLESWLAEWPGAVIVVSHDRAFLDRSVETVWELSASGLEAFRGNYSAYLLQREVIDLSATRAARALAEETRREREYIRRNQAGQNARQARGRQKKLDRRLSTQPPVRKVAAPWKLRFGAPDRSGDKALETRDLTLAHPDSRSAWLRMPDAVVARGECVAILGPNGAGKTTLLRTLAGEWAPASGEVIPGAKVQAGFLRQTLEDLHAGGCPLDTILHTRPLWRRSEAIAYLARFHFYGEEVEKPLEVLSGGERSRLALAGLVAQGANLLMLDEPTNHLDLPSQEVLQRALAEFPGTILLASHDRYLVAALATQVWTLGPGAQAVEVFPGPYAEFLARSAPESAPPARPRRARGPRPARRPAAPPRLEALEARIAELEDDRTQAYAALERAGSNLEEVRRWGTRCAEIEQELERHYALWETSARSGPQAP